ncbi:protein translocase subunit secG [Anseongella ginsenosidimutans]|uniref:Protein-export membrane protein SecG n=1 Tax=Anseongella ginsenosidimutans TaxID=496056 RepID=A0A4R3KWK4_9SPHI|nr:preprotein translocase subunit SecG [Anseongella ginsenosidimutans]QEC51312.1 preprotein translocase subunit SecG [Anseongella ginsenosidimutans]TCS89995.1 protein translocase subunit secG [Anseongella ginsenosidimutans]
MYAFLIVLAIIACLLLIVVILVQNPKGGGLSSTFGGSNQVMGVQRTGDFLEKATWAFAITLLAISLSTKFFIGEGGSVGESAIQEQIDRQAAPAPASPFLPDAAGGDEPSGSAQPSDTSAQ